MKALDFKEVVDLINKSRTTQIDKNPIDFEKGKWALYKGNNKVASFNYQFFIFYIHSDITMESINRSVKAISVPRSTQVVYAPKIKESYIDEFKKALVRNKKEISRILDLKTYLSSFIQDQMSSYIEKLRSVKPPFFIDPYYETPSQIKSKFPNPITLFFTDETEDVKDGALAVLLAEPGQGKTYTAQHIANALSEREYIPIYIHSSQWTTMQEGDLSSLYKTIIHSFRYYNSSIDWIEGEEENFIKLTLKVGLFRIIFDGFDEYILWNNGKISADETIKSLHELVQSSSARVLVTSRTTFWNSSITIENDLSSIFKYSILPFELEHARNYFSKKFEKNTKSFKKSVEVFSKLRGSGKAEFKNSFAGRGIILSLVADLCSDDINFSTYDENLSVWQWIITALCQREELRQKLPINPEKQLEILRMFVEEKAKGMTPDSILLSEIISLNCDRLSKEEITTLVGDDKTRGKFTDHPLISKDHITGLWYFKQEQIEFNLIAEFIINYAIDNKTNSIQNFFKGLVVRGSIIDDLTIVLIEQLNIINNNEKINLNTLLSNLRSCIPKESRKPRTKSYLAIVLTKIIIYYLNKNYPIGSTEKKLRAEKLLELLDENHIDSYHFTGTLSSLDFSEIKFNNCVFENIAWANCRFSSSTIFDDCFFIGGEIHNSEGFGSSNFKDNCEFDKIAEISINYEKIKHGNKKVESEDIIKDIVLFIRKFVPRDGVIKNVYDDGLLKGHLAISPNKDSILSVMKKYVIDENIDGSGHYYFIKKDARNSVNHYFNNGIFSGELAQAYNELLKKLKIE